MKRRRFLYCVGVSAILLALFLVTRYALPGLYTPEWAARRVFWPLAAVILLAAIYEKYRFSAATLIGYVAGLLAGELLGGWEADVGPEYRHHGWWIFLLIFVLFAAAGVVWQRERGNGHRWTA